jgi:spermidine synthase
LRECFTGPKRVAVIGLGVGTIAAYGRPGDAFRFYEINRQVEEVATSLFSYLRESHARTEIVTGDARLSLEQEHGPVFDVLAIDAFAGDAVPVHLITREALQLYIRRLIPNGVVAFHVSNDYLDLASVVARLAQDAGYSYVLVRNHDNEDDLVLASDWVLVTRNKDVLENASVKIHAAPVVLRPKARIWTDDYNNLLQILKTPQLH